MTTAIGSYATLAEFKVRANIGTADTADDTLMGDLCDQVNHYIETYTERVLAPVSGTPTYTFDGDGSTTLWYPSGIRAVALLEIALYTGGSYGTVPATDYMLRPHEQERPTGWPATRLELSDRPLGSYAWFPVGKDTIRVTMTVGWPAISDDIADVALTAAVRAWHSREAGQVDIVGTDEMGRPVVSRFFSARDYETLKRYSARSARIV